MSREGNHQSRIQENRITKSLREIGLQARRQVASGAKWYAKSDVVSDMFQVEAKTRAEKSKTITLKKEWFAKIQEEALQNNRIPLLVFSFGGGEDIYCLKERDFCSLMEELLERRDENEKISSGVRSG